jgi:HEXXH motif-containing protein
MRARAALDALDDATLLRILGAPEVCRAAAQYSVEPSAALLDQLEAWYAVEAALDDATATFDVPAWSALGDRRIPCGSPDDEDDWGVRGAVFAPTLHTGIVIDFDSPAARRPPKSNEYRQIRLEAPMPMPEVERQASTRKIDQALTALADACPSAYQVVTGMTQVIMPRKDREHPDYYTSASVRTAIGRVALANPYNEGVTIAQLASSLVHEAIHAYLYIEERTRPLVTEWDSAFETTVISPWTGSVLTLPTFLHACFVWHGLRALWRLPPVIARFGESTAALERGKADRGFAGRLTAALDRSRSLISPGTWSALERISDVR